MAKAKVTKSKLNDSESKANSYFEMYSQGAAIADICRKYGKSRNTVLKYLNLHPDFERVKGTFGKPGAGNTKTKAQGRKITPKNKHQGEKVFFYLPQELRDGLDNCPGQNRREKIVKAIEDYLKLKAKDRPQPILKGSSLDKPAMPKIPDNLVKKLDRTKGTRSGKIIAAIEMFITNHLI